jgi:hypothetical protein
MTKKLLVYLDEDFHEDLKELAHRKKASMASLVRYALDLTFEDDLDAIAGQRSLEEYVRDPSSAVSLDDYLKERGLALPSGDHQAGDAKSSTRSRRSVKPHLASNRSS